MTYPCGIGQFKALTFPALIQRYGSMMSVMIRAVQFLKRRFGSERPHYSCSAGTGVQDLSGLKRSIFLNSSRVVGPKSFS